MAKIRTKKEIMRSLLMYIFLTPMLIYWGYDIANRHILRNIGLETSATIVQVLGHRSGESRDPSIRVEYEIDNIIYRRNIRVRAESRTYVGEVVMIYYLASNHNNINLVSSDSRAISGFPGRIIMGWGIPVLFVSYGLWVISDLKKLKRAEKAKSN